MTVHDDPGGNDNSHSQNSGGWTPFCPAGRLHLHEHA